MLDVGQGDSLLLSADEPSRGARRRRRLAATATSAAASSSLPSSAKEWRASTSPSSPTPTSTTAAASSTSPPTSRSTSCGRAEGRGRLRLRRRPRRAPGPRLHPLAAGAVLSVGRWRFEALHPPPDRLTPAATTTSPWSSPPQPSAAAPSSPATSRPQRERTLTPHLAPPFDVLKVAHHGSKTSTTLPFLTTVHPRLALVSAGPHNPYGHPAPQVLARLQRAKAQILRTDRQGEVRLTWTQDSPIHIELPGLRADDPIVLTARESICSHSYSPTTQQATWQVDEIGSV